MKAICPKREYNEESNFVYEADAGCRRILSGPIGMGLAGSQIELAQFFAATQSMTDYNPAPSPVTAVPTETLDYMGTLLPMAQVSQRGVYVKNWTKSYFIRNPSTSVVKLKIMELHLESDFIKCYNVAGVSQTLALLNYLSVSSLKSHESTGNKYTAVASTVHPGSGIVANYYNTAAEVNVVATTEQYRFLTPEMRKDFKVAKHKSVVLLPGQEITYKVKMPMCIFDSADTYLPYAYQITVGTTDYFAVEARKNCCRIILFDFHGDLGCEITDNVYTAPNFKQCALAITVKDHCRIVPRFLGFGRNQVQEWVNKVVPSGADVIKDPQDENEVF